MPAANGSARGPICPSCREPLRSNLHQEQVIPKGGVAESPTLRTPVFGGKGTCVVQPAAAG
jgi:hypothetical protein